MRRQAPGTKKAATPERHDGRDLLKTEKPARVPRAAPPAGTANRPRFGYTSVSLTGECHGSVTLSSAFGRSGSYFLAFFAYFYGEAIVFPGENKFDMGTTQADARRMMILALFLAAAQPAGTPVDPATMSPSQQRAVAAMEVWMRCVGPRIQSAAYADAAAADAGADAAIAACRSEEDGVRAAFRTALPRAPADAVVQGFRDQLRTHARSEIAGAAPQR